jgi:4'-phosphopantetheinyl transferase
MNAHGIPSCAVPDVSVWYQWTKQLPPSELAAADTVLSCGERARRERFIFVRDRSDFTAAHWLLRRVLSAHTGVAPAQLQFCTGSHGKPALVSSQAGTPPVMFNLSHTPGVVACVVTRGARVGIDVERSERITDAGAIARQFFAGAELELLGECRADEYSMRFVELWTLKESYIKAVGLGLNLPLDSFAFTYDGAAGLRLSTGRGHHRWHVLLAALSPNTRMAVTVELPVDRRPPRIEVTQHGHEQPDDGVVYLRSSMPGPYYVRERARCIPSA